MGAISGTEIKLGMLQANERRCEQAQYAVYKTFNKEIV